MGDRLTPPAAAAAPIAIETSALSKRYGATLAVDALDLSIAAGQFFGLLGPNGAGKTSAIHMLSTLIKPTSGTARVAGFEIGAQPLEIRARIGVVFQELALDRTLSVAENLRFAGLLNGMARAEIKRRGAELLEIFGLGAKRDAPVAALSGGMRRALDIARGLIHGPDILFLDEPTAGLDLHGRRAIWRHIAQLRAARGITVFLTTHYLEEATDCDEVAFLAAGSVKMSGNPRVLVDQLGRHVLEIETDTPAVLAERLKTRLGEALVEGDMVQFLCNQAPAELAALQVELAESVRAVRWRRPNLNDVFMWVNREAGDVRRAA